MNDDLCGKELFIRFTARAFRKLLSIYVFSYFPFGFEGRIWDLIVSVLDHCLSFYFTFRRVCLDNMKINGLSCSPKLGILPGKDTDLIRGVCNNLLNKFQRLIRWTIISYFAHISSTFSSILYRKWRHTFIQFDSTFFLGLKLIPFIFLRKFILTLIDHKKPWMNMEQLI